MRMLVATVTMETGLFIFCACADNHAALLFINNVGGSRRGLSIRHIQLSGLLLEPRCPDNRGFTVYKTIIWLYRITVHVRACKYSCGATYSQSLQLGSQPFSLFSTTGNRSLANIGGTRTCIEIEGTRINYTQ